MKNYFIITCLALLLCLPSCDNWMDVKPKTMVDEEELFSRQNGFMEAIAGIYIKMANPTLYARNLSYGFVDILGQRYQNDAWGNATYYEFPSANTEGTTNAIWSAMYNEIANINNLLHWMNKNRHVFSTPGYYEMIRGEAMGMRAFLHFDLLRMYGPVYKNNPQQARISYRTEFSRDAKDAMASNLVVGKILEDLAEAERLLKDSDPLLFTFPKTEVAENLLYAETDSFLTYRQFRMNLYAVKALMARVHLYAGNTVEAAKYAQEVIDSKQFELIDDPLDRMRSKEIIFGIYVYKFDLQVATDFFSDNPLYSIATRAFLEEQFSVTQDGSNDSRLVEGTGFERGGNVYVPLKYRQTSQWWSTANSIRLIGLPEMYYILAECTTDIGQAAKYLSRVRDKRGLDPASYNSQAAMSSAIEREYRKEFYGEGQLFFFYKRLGYETFLHCPITKMVDANYMFSIPDDEITFGKTTN